MARPDITLMDSQTPEMNGLGAMVVIRTEFADVILTTYSSEVEGAMKLSARAYLTVGETSTGKELIACIIRKKSPGTVSVNCAAVAPPLISSELVADEKRALTARCCDACQDLQSKGLWHLC